MPDQKKIVFVVDTLAQHGAERYLYEILKAIDRSKFDCSVLCTYPLTDANNHYEQSILALDIPISTFELGELYPNVRSNVKRKLYNALTYRWLGITGRKEEIQKRSEAALHQQLIGYDLISILKIEVFNRFPAIFASYPNLVIHLLSWGIQYLKNPYENLPNRPYRFVTMIDSQRDDVLETNFSLISEPTFDFYAFPLLLDLTGRENNYTPKTENPIIGVFSRINYDQPTIMFLFAFHLLLKRLPTVKMYFYGKAVSEEYLQFYRQTAEILGISHAIVFKGHVSDLKKSIDQDEISMGWMNIGNSTLGYSSIEISSMGLPVAFFNIDKHDPTKIDDRLAVFNDMEAFAEHSHQVIVDAERLTEESDKLFDFIQTNHNAEIIISQLEDYYLRSAGINV